MTRALVVIVIAACSNPPAPAPPVPVDPHVATIDHLVGVWAGQAIGTPFGDFRFGIAFDRKPAGSVHGRLDGAPGMYLDFTFARGALVETGAIPSLGVQTHTLAAAAGTHWHDDTVDVDLQITGDQLVWTTSIRGTKHSEFRMQRETGDDAVAVRRAIATRLNSR